MTPQICLVKHDPPHSYGDCFRACVASILDLPTDDVPHFYHDGADGDVGTERVREFLNGLGYTIVWFAFDGEALPLDEMLNIWGQMNPDVPAILLASNRDSDHAVVMRGDKIVHDPSWIRSSITGPNSNGYWNILVIAVK